MNPPGVPRKIVPRGFVHLSLITERKNIRWFGERQYRPLGQNRVRELRVCGAITAPSRNGGKGTKEHALHRRRRRVELNHVNELQRKQRQLQWMRHALSVRVTEAGETEYRLSLEDLLKRRKPVLTRETPPHQSDVPRHLSD
jgi:hypothetical protein